LQEQYPEIVEQSQNLFKVRQEGYRTEIRSAKEKIIQRKQDVIEVEARLDNLADRFDIAEEQVAISEDLLRDELTNRYNHLELLREVSVIKSSIEEDEAALIRTEAQLDEMRATFDGIRHSYVEEISTQVEEASAQLAEAEERMLKLADSLLRTVLTAPEDGVVQTMYAHTVGGVVKPGETVIDIVPAGDQLIIEARLPVQDVGYVANGQLATIRLSSADAMRFDKLDGNVIYIAADTTLDEATGEYFYKVRIETAATQFSGSGSMNYQLYPGMQVVSNIVIGRRSTLEYILSPFLESSFGAMQER
jgi:adhesin transport system membrane fusion protein